MVTGLVRLQPMLAMPRESVAVAAKNVVTTAVDPPAGETAKLVGHIMLGGADSVTGKTRDPPVMTLAPVVT